MAPQLERGRRWAHHSATCTRSAKSGGMTLGKVAAVAVEGEEEEDDDDDDDEAAAAAAAAADVSADVLNVDSLDKSTICW